MALVPRGYRLYCSKGLDKKIVIANHTLDFLVDGVNYSVILDSGAYETLHEPFYSELPDMINQVLDANGVPILCKLGGVYDYVDNRTVLVFEHKDVNIHHDLDVIGGTAYPLLVGSILNADSHEDGIFDAENDKLGTIKVVYPDISELSSEVAVRRKVIDDSFKGTISARRSNTSSIGGSVRVVSASRLTGNLTVRGNDFSEIPGTIAIPTDGAHDLGSFLIIKVLS